MTTIGLKFCHDADFLSTMGWVKLPVDELSSSFLITGGIKEACLHIQQKLPDVVSITCHSSFDRREGKSTHDNRPNQCLTG